MFNFLQNLTKSAAVKRQEAVTAYVDGALNARARQQLEQAMAQDDALRQEVEQLMLVKQSLRKLPQREVPRNFVLDPATFRDRPKPEPWVQAYPVLRTATAMAAFFFIFALASGLFTQFNAGMEQDQSTAADVAEVQNVEVTRVVTDAAESLAYEAEFPAEEEAAAAEPVEEAAEETAEEAADEAVADEEAADEESAPAVNSAGDALQEDPAEDEASPSPQATATVSTLPRVTPPTPLPERNLEFPEEGDGADDDAIAGAPEPDAGDETGVLAPPVAETTAVPVDEPVQEMTGDGPENGLLWVQIGLGALALLLAGLTIYARRQR